MTESIKEKEVSIFIYVGGILHEVRYRTSTKSPRWFQSGVKLAFKFP
ncbi:hypothetical protein [Bacillus sp. B1-b2]|nr:hypothetical protein [Bacillus sp. B1-b2]